MSEPKKPRTVTPAQLAAMREAYRTATLRKSIKVSEDAVLTAVGNALLATLRKK